MFQRQTRWNKGCRKTCKTRLRFNLQLPSWSLCGGDTCVLPNSSLFPFVTSVFAGTLGKYPSVHLWHLKQAKITPLTHTTESWVTHATLSSSHGKRYLALEFRLWGWMVVLNSNNGQQLMEEFIPWNNLKLLSASVKLSAVNDTFTDRGVTLKAIESYIWSFYWQMAVVNNRCCAPALKWGNVYSDLAAGSAFLSEQSPQWLNTCLFINIL